jgi:hypothetical protein
VDEGSDITLAGSATDVPSDTLSYAWDTDSDGFNDGTDPVLVYTGTDGPSSPNIRLRVSDEDGGSTVVSHTVTVANRAPWDVTITGPDRVTDGYSITLTGSATDVPSDTLSYAWDTDGDGFDDGVGLTLVYTGTGGLDSTNIRLAVSDEDGGSTIVSHTVTIIRWGAAITGPDTVTEGSAITLTGSVTGTPIGTLSYAWDVDGDGFDDGTGPTLVYTGTDGPNSATLRLIATDDNGSDVVSHTVTVTNLEPWNVAITGPNAVDEGNSITLTGSATDVPSDTLSYAWDTDGDGFDDGVGATLVYTGTGGPSSPNIRLRASDEDGGSIVVSHTITVANRAPWNVTITGPDRVAEGYSITLTGSATDVPSDTLSYAWDIDGDGFDDGVGLTLVYTGTSGLSSANIRLRVSDEDGGSTVVSHTVAVIRWGATITGPDTVTEGSAITLTGSVTGTPNGTVSYAWDVDGDGFDDGTDPTLVYVGTDGPDSVTLRLRATDDNGPDIVSHTVTVTNVAPLPTITAPDTAVSGEEVSFIANVDDPGDDTFEYTWDWSDGTGIVITTTATVSHMFTSADVYTITLNVTDDDGGTGETRHVIDVKTVTPYDYFTYLPIVRR